MTIAALKDSVAVEIAERYPCVHSFFLAGIKRLNDWEQLTKELPRLRDEHAKSEVDHAAIGDRQRHCDLVIAAVVSIAERVLQDPDRYARRFRSVLRRRLPLRESDVDDGCQHVLEQLLRVQFPLNTLSNRICTLDGVLESFGWTEQVWQGPRQDSIDDTDLHQSHDAWLRSMCETFARQVNRSRQRLIPDTDKIALERARSVPPDAQLLEQEAQAMFRSAVSDLDQLTRQIVELLLTGSRPKEIQKKLKVRHATFYRMLSNGRVRLNEILRGRGLSLDDFFL